MALSALNKGDEEFSSERLEALGAPPPAICRPWSQSDFDCRLKSFGPGTWFAKPDVIAPPECARQGWTNTEMDALGCVSCGKELKFGFSGLLHDDHEAAAKNFAKYLKVIPFFKHPNPGRVEMCL